MSSHLFEETRRASSNLRRVALAYSETHEEYREGGIDDDALLMKVVRASEALEAAAVEYARILARKEAYDRNPFSEEA